MLVRIMVSREEVIEVMKTVEDPELFLDIWFLGLIYSIDINDSVVAIDMTFTTPLCPAGLQLVEEVRSKTLALDDVTDVQVKVVFSPPWQPSDEVKGMLGMM
jgi:metal-sulfur cluster biosynthetic enzyme